MSGDRDDLGKLPPRTDRIGPFSLINDGNTLVLRFEDRGEMSFNGCLVIALLLCGVLLFGALAIYQFANETSAGTIRPGAPLHASPAQMLLPSENHFGLVWLTSALGVLIVIPFYVARTYKSALMYTFRRSDDALLRNDRIVTQLRRIEHLVIQEVNDPDGRYLYNLELVYGDGLQLQLHSGYDEREIKNIANEIASFVNIAIRWRE